MRWSARLCAASRGSLNVPEEIWKHRSAGLHLRSGHPLCTTRRLIEDYHRNLRGRRFKFWSDLDSVTSTKACFDDLLVEPDHPSRRISDTYYVNGNHVLRPHMTAHDVQLLRQGEREFVITGDVFRRDAIDRSHFPVFHQTDGVRVLKHVCSESMVQDLQETLQGLVSHLFGTDTKTRWIDAYFPFTDPSFELEVEWNGEWLELLGCGLLRHGVLQAGSVEDEEIGWAYGLGLERLAMVLFEIPDIRLFWSDDRRFVEQFQPGKVTAFKPYSKHPVCYKDVSFWLPQGFHENDFYELVRTVGGNLVERVELIDDFEKPGTGKSHCYRVSYRSMDRNLTNSEVDVLQERVRKAAEQTLRVTLR
ncbi:hypothetical protein NDN08_006034 [Rhodosorus marinus]|uniref:phenylalanine--tRNA ligase n=1 Tax=Rhodosorus marinus TaxID=101924 RepID=A0AAV8UK17_9RHOD|nr:hypothetical protein NDN08_006034 [Rhodosorus marinus]